MATGPRKARDLDLLDAVDALDRIPFSGTAWRVARDGRDPTLGGRSESRWCNGEFDVLYTSLVRDGALAEIHALLSMQPVFPSKPVWRVHELRARTSRTLHLADMSALERLSIEPGSYRDRRYERTQSVADAAFFLDFDGLLVPSARWECQNLVLFTERLQPEDIEAVRQDGTAIDWADWRRAVRSASG